MSKIILSIETSCDETSIAIVKEAQLSGAGGAEGFEEPKILSMQTYSQIEKHSSFGGVVPELAAREHIEKISALTKLCLGESKIQASQIDYIAVTTSPGLMGALLVGIVFAKGLSVALQKPIIEVNHLSGHIFTTYLTHGLREKFYCLLISGGHCQTIRLEHFNNKQIVGQTIDDSVGEAFDKLSKKLGFGYPGGPIVEQTALAGNPLAYPFKIPMQKNNDYDFSFSGLKTHFLNIIQNNQLSEADIANLCASFQKVVADILINRTLNMIAADGFAYKSLVICGGVAANKYIFARFKVEIEEEHGIKIITPPLKLCTDNAAMIAAAALVSLKYT